MEPRYPISADWAGCVDELVPGHAHLSCLSCCLLCLAERQGGVGELEVSTVCNRGITSHDVRREQILYGVSIPRLDNHALCLTLRLRVIIDSRVHSGVLGVRWCKELPGVSARGEAAVQALDQAPQPVNLLQQQLVLCPQTLYI